MTPESYLQNRISFVGLLVAASAVTGLIISAIEAGDESFPGTVQAQALRPNSYANLISYQPLPEMNGST